ncbi:ATP-grasp ribosomal peptide maturase [Nocardiopsis dassonvillei]|uniref:ATP-grasp ribosomal peptide maturase n=1 Tax=Nocardiopsis dassonvillei TaxID=2014 RepID=UPI00157CB446|nr:ATP-grasp ribosomal peptide maturase [Nocardiopsis dassonvillei]
MEEPTVLVVTNIDDPTADLVINELNRRNVPVARMDPGDFPASLTASARTAGDGGWGGALSTSSRTIPLDRVRSLYYRRPSGFSFPHLTAQDERFAVTQARYGLGGVLASLPGCRYVNHPNRIGDAEFKPLGLAVAGACGFAVPDTLITNEEAQAREFVEGRRSVIYKPLWVPLYTRDDTPQTIAVSMVTAEELDDSIAGTMHLLQERVEKAYDVRVTVMGERVFAVRIDSGLLDWRTDYTVHTYKEERVPPAIVCSLHAYLSRLGLVFGAFDFAVDHEGVWWFLECNPSGQWAWLEEETGLPMVAALADLLTQGTE